MIHGLTHAHADGMLGNAHEHGLIGDAYHGLSAAQIAAIKAKGGGGDGNAGGGGKGAKGGGKFKGNARPFVGSSYGVAKGFELPKHPPGGAKPPPPASSLGKGPAQKMAPPKVSDFKTDKKGKPVAHLGAQDPRNNVKAMPKMPKPPSPEAVKKAQDKQAKQGERNVAAGIKRVEKAQKDAAKAAAKNTTPHAKPISVEKHVKQTMGHMKHIEHAGSKKGGVLGEMAKIGGEAATIATGGGETVNAVTQKNSGHKK